MSYLFFNCYINLYTLASNLLFDSLSSMNKSETKISLKKSINYQLIVCLKVQENVHENRLSYVLCNCRKEHKSTSNQTTLHQSIATDSRTWLKVNKLNLKPNATHINQKTVNILKVDKEKHNNEILETNR